MITADSSVVIDYINGVNAPHTDMLEHALVNEELKLCPVVITELHGIKSSPNERWQHFINNIPLLDIMPGYWQRAGELRQLLLARGVKAKLGDALIAQCAIDHRLPLLTRDADFQRFSTHGELMLALKLSH